MLYAARLTISCASLLHFYCGQYADSDGVEGKYYTFTPNEITKVLGKEKGEKFCLMYGITDKGNFEGKSIPNLIGKSDDAMRADAPELEAIYEYRKQRVSLRKDDKILLSWNGWTIAALARVGFTLNDTRYLSAAVTAQRFIEKKMTACSTDIGTARRHIPGKSMIMRFILLRFWSCIMQQWTPAI